MLLISLGLRGETCTVVKVDVAVVRVVPMKARKVPVSDKASHIFPGLFIVLPSVWKIHVRLGAEWTPQCELSFLWPAALMGEAMTLQFLQSSPLASNMSEFSDSILDGNP